MTKKMIFGIGNLLLAGLLVMYFKYYVASLRHHVSKQQAHLTELQGRMRLLSLEWAHLNAPERLDHLSKQFLHFSAMTPEQMKGAF